MWVPQGVLERISHRHSGNYPRVLTLMMDKSCGSWWRYCFGSDRCTMNFHATQIWTSWLLHALYTAMVLSCGMLLKPISIHPLDETSSILFMFHKGTKCENSYWPIMTDLPWCGLWWFQECSIWLYEEVPPGQGAWWAWYLRVSWVCVLPSHFHAFLILLISSQELIKTAWCYFIF